MTTKSLSALRRPVSPEDFLEVGRSRTVVLVLLAILSAVALSATARLFGGPVDAPPQPIATAQLEPAQVAVEPRPAETVTTSAPSKMIEALAGFLARKYRVSQDVTLELVSTAYTEGGRVGVDPLLIIAVMAVESRFNPIAESVAGAKGLMQVIPRYHPEKFTAADHEDAALDPETNIQVGARILKEYIQRGGSLVAGLQMYNGSPNDRNNSYANKVLGEQQRLAQVVRRLRIA